MICSQGYTSSMGIIVMNTLAAFSDLLDSLESCIICSVVMLVLVLMLTTICLI